MLRLFSFSILAFTSALVSSEAFAKQRFTTIPDIPKDLNLASKVYTEDKSEELEIIKPKDHLPAGQLHNWLVCSKSANIPKSAHLSFFMPQHQHGMNTSPKVTVYKLSDLPAALKNQELVSSGMSYCIQAEGVRFHMKGWWQLRLELVGQFSKFALFNFVLGS